MAHVSPPGAAGDHAYASVTHEPPNTPASTMVPSRLASSGSRAIAASTGSDLPVSRSDLQRLVSPVHTNGNRGERALREVPHVPKVCVKHYTSQHTAACISEPNGGGRMRRVPSWIPCFYLLLCVVMLAGFVRDIQLKTRRDSLPPTLPPTATHTERVEVEWTAADIDEYRRIHMLREMPHLRRQAKFIRAYFKRCLML